VQYKLSKEAKNRSAGVLVEYARKFNTGELSLQDAVDRIE